MKYKVCLSFCAFYFPFFSLQTFPFFPQTTPFHQCLMKMCNICKRTSGLHEEWRQLQVRNCHNICFKLKLIAGLPSALLLSMLPAYQRTSARWHLTVLADFLPSLSSPAASVVSWLSYETQSAIWQQATCTACDIKMHTLLPNTQTFNQSDMPLNPQDTNTTAPWNLTCAVLNFHWKLVSLRL